MVIFNRSDSTMLEPRKLVLLWPPQACWGEISNQDTDQRLNHMCWSIKEWASASNNRSMSQFIWFAAWHIKYSQTQAEIQHQWGVEKIVFLDYVPAAALNQLFMF